MSWGYKYRQYILSVFFLALAWNIVNYSYYGHSHKLTGNKVVFHAHPFNKQQSPSEPYKQHKHTQWEYVLLQSLSNNFYIPALLLIIAGLFLFSDEKKKLVFIKVFSSKVFNASQPHRGPPSFTV